MLQVMLSVDLSQGEKQRPDFNKELLEAGFIKLSNVDTVWGLTVPGNVESKTKEAELVIRKRLKTIVANLEIPKISFVAQIGNNKPVGAVIEKIHGTYEVEEFNPMLSVD